MVSVSRSTATAAGALVEADEDLFVVARLEARRTQFLKQSIFVALAFHAACLVIAPLAYPKAWMPWVYPTHAELWILNLFLLASIVWPLGIRSRSRVLLFSIADLTLLATMMAGNVALRISDSRPENIASANWYTLTVAIHLMLSTRLRGAALIVFAAAVAAMSVPTWFMPSEFKAIDIWRWVYPLFVAGTLPVRLAYNALERHAARTEYRQLAQLAPRQIVRRSSDTLETVDQLFAPESRFCVCICSDWRDYQSLTESMPADTLAGVLRSYYEMTESLLDQCFPEGNFFSDWIADELFVVAYLPRPGQEERLRQAALMFAQRLLAEKQRFHALRGVPAGIDVGISAGVAAVGIMGPGSHRKATALGNVPGRARRLQNIGKSLRKRFGNYDRLICGIDTAEGLEVGLERIDVDAEMGARDLADSFLFFDEAKPAAREAKSA